MKVMIAFLALALCASVLRGQTCDRFIRGDADSDGDVDSADAEAIGNCLFYGIGCPPARDALDADDSGQADIADISYVNNYVNGGPPPPHPFPDACWDPTEDSIERCCTNFAGNGAAYDAETAQNDSGGGHWLAGPSRWDTYSGEGEEGTTKFRHTLTNSDACDRLKDTEEYVNYWVMMDEQDTFRISGRLARSMKAAGAFLAVVFEPVSIKIETTIGGDCNGSSCHAIATENRVNVRVDGTAPEGAHANAWFKSEAGNFAKIVHDLLPRCLYEVKYRDQNLFQSCGCETEWLRDREHEDTKCENAALGGDSYCMIHGSTVPGYVAKIADNWVINLDDLISELPDTCDIYGLDMIHVSPSIKVSWYGSGNEDDYDISESEEMVLTCKVPENDTVTAGLSHCGD